MPSIYADMFKTMQPAYDPRHIEGWIRVEYPTLDHLSREKLERAAIEAAQCIELAEPEESEAVAQSYGL